MPQGRLFIGTSGYSYPHWRSFFYPAELRSAEWLPFYAREFNAVELNVTFYRLPRPSTWDRWRQSTPPSFSFAVKGHRSITHWKRLHGAEEEMERFLHLAAHLEGKLAVILWQLPPGLSLKLQTLEDFCRSLQRSSAPLGCRHAFEFRHSSWFCLEVYELLRRYNFALCWADAPRWPRVEEVTADFIYLRFHGHDQLYASSYPTETLSRWARIISQQLKAGKDVYAFFNNDAGGYAVANARELRELVKSLNPPVG
ncbi:DUF72 domain-containing protein [Desulfothermobacter acidiphilus]|uniref:DUF72 domain-containing protein n=1 Tax=Desulfothermobacter acidiphilus TaxID=1938353 RepID=UPI003F8A8DAD